MDDPPEQPDDIDVLLRNYAASRRSHAADTPDLQDLDIRRLAAQARVECQPRKAPGLRLAERWCCLLGTLSAPQWAALGATAAAVLGFALWLPTRGPGGDDERIATAAGGNPAQPGDSPRSASQLFSMKADIFRNAPQGNQDTNGVPDGGNTESTRFHSVTAAEGPREFEASPKTTPQPSIQPKAETLQFDLTLNLAKREVVLKFSNGMLLSGNLQPDEGDQRSGNEPMSYGVSASGTSPQTLPVLFKGVLRVVEDPGAPQRAKEVSLQGILSVNSQEVPIRAVMNKP